MRNIKLTFEHPCYIYPFKLNLFHSTELERISYSQTEEAVKRIRQHLILTSEEEKIFDTLSIGTPFLT